MHIDIQRKPVFFYYSVSSILLQHTDLNLSQMFLYHSSNHLTIWFRSFFLFSLMLNWNLRLLFLIAIPLQIAMCYLFSVLVMLNVSYIFFANWDVMSLHLLPHDVCFCVCVEEEQCPILLCYPVRSFFAHKNHAPCLITFQPGMMKVSQIVYWCAPPGVIFVCPLGEISFPKHMMR